MNKNKEKLNNLLDKYKEAEIGFLEFILGCSADLNNLFQNENKQHRLYLIVCFSMIDVMSQFWDIYNDKVNIDSQKLTFYKYINDCCYCSENNTYSQNRFFSGISSEDLYRLRNSIVHFMSLGKDFLLTEKQTLDNFEKKKTAENVRKIKKMIVIDEFKDLIMDSIDVFIVNLRNDMEKVNEESDTLKSEYAKKIIEMYEKVRSEGAPVALSMSTSKRITYLDKIN